MPILERLFGTPPNYEQAKAANEVVKAPEFEVTQYAKKLAVAVGALTPAIVASLKAAGVEDVTPGMVIGALAVTAAALLGASFVMGVDIAARAYATRGAAAPEDSPKGAGAGGAGSLTVAVPGTIVWLKGQEQPCPVLAISGTTSETSAYLVASGSRSAKVVDGSPVVAFDDAPAWVAAGEVTACHVPGL